MYMNWSGRGSVHGLRSAVQAAFSRYSAALTGRANGRTLLAGQLFTGAAFGVDAWWSPLVTATPATTAAAAVTVTPAVIAKRRRRCRSLVDSRRPVDDIRC